MKRYYTAALASLDGIGPADIGKIIEFFGSPQEAWRAPLAEWKRAGIIGHAISEPATARKKQQELPEKIAEICRLKNIKLCIQEDEEYPELLREIPSAPQVLFYKGTLQNHLPRISMVGSRKLTPYGRAVAEQLSVSLASKGFSVVSGGAYGIDSVSHKGALSAGTTEAVLGCGIDVYYPPSNRRLIDEIAEKGAVVSEYMPGTAPIACFFPARNRIIAGMSLGTVVVEAAEKSGSLITAEFAFSFDRDVFAVPGSIFSPSSKGCNKLLRECAKVVLDSDDIITEYKDFIKCKTFAKKSANMIGIMGLTKDEERILALLSPDIPKSVDEIIMGLHGHGVANVAVTLLMMETKGIVRSDNTQSYVRISKGDIL